MAAWMPERLERGARRVLSVVPSRLDPILPPNLDRRPKVFGIGFHKTGTTSLGRALRILGYRVQKGMGFNRPGKRVQIEEPVTLEKVRDAAFRMIPRYSAFEDNPWPLLFRDVDAAFPGSRFILTVRDSQSWLRSVVNYRGRKVTPMRDLIYGRRDFQIPGNEDAAVERLERHTAEVIEHFKDRPDDLLVWNLSSDPGWDVLCRFLGCPTPRRQFPHGKNSAKRKQSPGPLHRAA